MKGWKFASGKIDPLSKMPLYLYRKAQRNIKLPPIRSRHFKWIKQSSAISDLISYQSFKAPIRSVIDLSDHIISFIEATDKLFLTKTTTNYLIKDLNQVLQASKRSHYLNLENTISSIYFEIFKKRHVYSVSLFNKDIWKFSYSILNNQLTKQMISCTNLVANKTYCWYKKQNETYYGSIESQRPNGYGFKTTYKDDNETLDSQYIGQFQNGMYHGLGFYVKYTNNLLQWQYAGHFKDNVFHVNCN